MAAPAPIRFSPPTGDLPRDLRWVLARALSSPDSAVDPPGAGVFDLAVALGMAPRIGSRIASRQLAQESGRVAAARFLHASETVRAREDGLADLVSSLSAAAEGRGLPLAFLKYAGLLLAGRLTPGSRPACDVDVLVPERRLDEARGVLVTLGFVTIGGDADPHQLPALRDARGRVAELHRHIPHVSVPHEKGAATYDALLRAGALVPVRTGCHHLSTELAAAHAIAHAVAQNGFFPAASPFLRAMADLVDLGTPAGTIAAASLLPWLARELAPAEVEGCLDLAAWCARGALPPADAPASRLLAHAVWGGLDEAYRRRLRAEYLRQVPRRAWRSPESRHALRVLLFPSAAAFAQIYGYPRRGMRGWGTACARPLVLGWRHLTAPHGEPRVR